VPSHLAAFKDCPAETGRGYGEGLTFFNNAQSGNPGGFTTQDRCQELPTREKGVRGEEGGRGGGEERGGARGGDDARRYGCGAHAVTLTQGMCA